MLNYKIPYSLLACFEWGAEQEKSLPQIQAIPEAALPLGNLTTCYQPAVYLLETLSTCA